MANKFTRINSKRLEAIPDMLLTIREAAALKRVNLHTMRSRLRSDLLLRKIGRTCYVWMTDILDMQIPCTLSIREASELIGESVIALSELNLSAQRARVSLGIGVDPAIYSIKDRNKRRTIRKIRNLTGETPPIPRSYKYRSLIELESIAQKLREAQIK